MRKNTLIILICFILLLTILVGVAIVFKYWEASILCEQIKNGEEIDTNFSNGTTAPIFFDEIASIMQIGGPKIPLVEACYYRNVQAVEVLLENGADPNFYIDGRWTALEAAIVSSPAGSMDERNFEIIKLLVEHGADFDRCSSLDPVIDQLSDWISLGGEPFDEFKEEVLLYLLDNTKNPNDYNTCFCDAVKSGNLGLAKIVFADYDMDINYKGYQGKTPLINLIIYPRATHQAEMISFLLENGADKSLTDDNGKTAYDYAIETGNQEIIDLLS